MTGHDDKTQRVNPLLPIPGAQKSPDKRTTQILGPEQEAALQRRLEGEPVSRIVIDLRRVMLRIVDSGESIQINAPQQALIGRSDPGMIEKPEVDLSRFAGYRMGISRRHARIVRNEDGKLLICDLGSSNGTFVNEVRLMPHILHPLHDGDFVRLGKLITQVDAKLAYRRETVDQQSAKMKDAKAQ